MDDGAFVKTMRDFHDPSMASAGFHRQDISVIPDQDFDQVRPSTRLETQETSKGREFAKKTGKFLVSHVGLVILVGVYATAGGFLFELLEQHQDQLACQEAQGEFEVEVTQLKQKIVNYIQQDTVQGSTATSMRYPDNLDNSTIAYTKIAEMLVAYRTFVIDTSAQYRYSSDDCSLINKWTFANSLLFAITIFTTIGYGNITPVTSEGQICCICYATIGIPIFLLCLTNLSGVLGEMFRFLYGKIICRPCHIIQARRAMAKKAKIEEETGIRDARAGNRGWAMDDGRHSANGMRKAEPTPVTANDLDDDDGQQGQNQRITVPLTITMLIIALYITLGSLMFNQFEGWTMTQAGYFCFITLSTIGFGDFVPGQNKDEPNATAKLIAGAIYVLIGMAILAMCFDLMQEEIVAKFRWIGRKMGILDKNESSSSLNSNEKEANNQRRSSIATASVNSPSPTLNNREKSSDDDNEYAWPNQRPPNSARKLSPRNNIARVHPMTDASNEGTLHQRSSSTKLQ